MPGEPDRKGTIKTKTEVDGQLLWSLAPRLCTILLECQSERHRFVMRGATRAGHKT